MEKITTAKEYANTLKSYPDYFIVTSESDNIVKYKHTDKLANSNQYGPAAQYSEYEGNDVIRMMIVDEEKVKAQIGIGEVQVVIGYLEFPIDLTNVKINIDVDTSEFSVEFKEDQSAS